MTLDAELVEVLCAHRARCNERAGAAGHEGAARRVRILPRAGLFVQTNPDTVTQRYGRLAARLGIDTHLYSLRHYSATEFRRRC